jgi:hypothetical protein
MPVRHPAAGWTSHSMTGAPSRETPEWFGQQGYYIDLFHREAREVLKMRHNGEYYLLIENGIFDAANPPGSELAPRLRPPM